MPGRVPGIVKGFASRDGLIATTNPDWRDLYAELLREDGRDDTRP